MTENISPLLNTRLSSKDGDLLETCGFEYNFNDSWFEPEFPTPFITRDTLKEKGLVGNGCNALTRGPLAKFYDLEIVREKGSRIKGFRVLGRKEDPNMFKQTIPVSVRKALLVPGASCPITGQMDTLEIDHRDGRKESTCFKVSEYQVLSKTANDIKRQNCKDCKKTGKRYDATRMKFKLPVSSGSLEYEGTCKGCFWYDPIDFRAKVPTVYN